MADAVPPILAQDPTFGPLAQLTERLTGLDMSRLLIYLVDLVEDDALPYLGEQFHIMGGEGWDFAADDAARRALIKSAIELHRYKGTPWAIKQALDKIGYPESELVEHRGYHQQWTDAGGRVLDGSWHTDGTINLNPPAGGDIRRLALNHWAEYAIRLNIGDGAWSRDQQRAIRRMAELYAPARCHLKGLLTRASLSFDAGIRLVDARQRVRTRFDRCKRLTAHRWKTLDGCWLLDDDYAASSLDGSWALDDGRSLAGVTPAGEPLDGGFASFAARGRSRYSLRAAGGDRVTASEPLVPPPRLDGTLRLDGRKLDGRWPLDGAAVLDYPTLSTLGQRRLDGTWHLGRVPGRDGVWFSAVATIRRGGVITCEVL